MNWMKSTSTAPDIGLGRIGWPCQGSHQSMFNNNNIYFIIIKMKSEIIFTDRFLSYVERQCLCQIRYQQKIKICAVSLFEHAVIQFTLPDLLKVFTEDESIENSVRMTTSYTNKGSRYTPPRNVPPRYIPPRNVPLPTLFRFEARFARVRIEDSSRNRFTSTAYFT